MDTYKFCCDTPVHFSVIKKNRKYYLGVYDVDGKIHKHNDDDDDNTQKKKQCTQ